MTKEMIRDAFGDPVPQLQNDDGSFTVLSNGDVTNVDFSKYKLIRDAFGDPIPYQYFDVEQNKFVAGVLSGSGDNDVQANEIPFTSEEMNATNVQDAILESFQYGDSIKQRLITMLSQIDDNMPLWEGSTWVDIFDELPFIQGGRALGNVRSSSNDELFNFVQGANTRNCYYVQDSYDLDSEPSKIIIRGVTTSGERFYTIFDRSVSANSVVTFATSNGIYSGNSFSFKTGTSNCYITNKGFKFPFLKENLTTTWETYRV